MVWALQILYACRNLCLKPTAYNSLNLYYSSIDVLGKIFLSLCAELYKTNIDLCSPAGSRGLCSPPVIADVIEKMLCIHTQDHMWSIQVSQGF